MARKNNYKVKNHPVTEAMNTGTQTGRLIGKLNVAMKDNIEPVEPEIEILIIDGNGTIEDGLFDGNVNSL